MTLEIDHIVVCVANLDDAAQDFERDFGVTSVAGGRHTGHGTANRLVPMGDSYIELLGVVDPTEARSSALGTWASHRAGVCGADAICLRTNDLDSVGNDLDLQQMEMSRVTPDGIALRWRLAGLEQSLSTGLPFFIEWQIPDHLHPGRTEVAHPAGEVALAGVTVTGALEELRRWTAGAKGVTVRQGEPGVTYRLVTGPGIRDLPLATDVGHD